MIIDTNTLKNIANQIISAHATANRNDMESKKNYVRVRANSIIKQLDVIRAIAPAFNSLKSAKINFINTFFTDSYNHEVGFSISHNDLIGIWGEDGVKSVFVNFRNEKFIICDPHCENNWCVREINIDILIEKYWDNYYVRRYLSRIDSEITIFAERVATSITAAV